jgi:NitT/TauT family transport system substrate-binding protein
MVSRQSCARRAFLASAATALVASSLPTAANAQSPAQVRIRTLPIDEGGQAFYAQERGSFAGADVGTMPTGPGIVAAVASGEIDIGFANLFAFVQAFARGAPIRILAPGQLFRVEDSKSFVLAVRRDSPYRTAKDLNGKTIGANAPVSIVAIGARAWIDRNGGDSSTITVVQVPFGSEERALADGRVDAVSTTFTLLADAKNARILGNPTDAIGPPFIGSAWYARAPWIDAHRDAARGYARALSDAARWANANPSDSGRILMKYLRLTPETLQAMSAHRVIYAETLDPSLLEPLIGVATRYGVIPAAVSARAMIADVG